MNRIIMLDLKIKGTNKKPQPNQKAVPSALLWYGLLFFTLRGAQPGRIVQELQECALNSDLDKFSVKERFILAGVPWKCLVQPLRGNFKAALGCPGNV